MANKILIVGNWKMNPLDPEAAKAIARKTRTTAADLRRTEVVACPPIVFASLIMPRDKAVHFSVGAQTVSMHESGAHTGEVSALMLKELGLTHVIVGHSEERAAGLTDEMVAKRILAVLSAGLTPILCVGEAVRDDNGSYFDHVKIQLKASLAGVTQKSANDIVVAYEPVWAIGAAAAMQPEQIREMAIFIKKVYSDLYGSAAGLKAAVLYGGSVNYTNAAEIVSLGQVDGLLVGRESVNPRGFADLLKSVDAVS
ncbi:MAG: triose-phosphate isomerase [Patescibacteria group bacterium]|nr:triose-phosphate isomerase [Patescibacteria group bacterium]